MIQYVYSCIYLSSICVTVDASNCERSIALFAFDQPVHSDFIKTIFFSKEGKVLKVKEYKEFDDFNISFEMLFFPSKKNFVRILANHDTQKRHVFLYDSEFKTIKELYEGPFI